MIKIDNDRIKRLIEQYGDVGVIVPYTEGMIIAGRSNDLLKPMEIKYHEYKLGNYYCFHKKGKNIDLAQIVLDICQARNLRLFENTASVRVDSYGPYDSFTVSGFWLSEGE